MLVAQGCGMGVASAADRGPAQAHEMWLRPQQAISISGPQFPHLQEN